MEKVMRMFYYKKEGRTFSIYVEVTDILFGKVISDKRKLTGKLKSEETCKKIILLFKNVA